MKNLNELAQEVAAREVGNVQVDIAQIKEILRITCEIMAENPRLVDEMIERGLENINQREGSDDT